MVLTHDELRSLVEVRHQQPHQLLGMHPLGGRHGRGGAGIRSRRRRGRDPAGPRKGQARHQAQAHSQDRPVRRRHQRGRPRLCLRPGDHRRRRKPAAHPRSLFVPAHAGRDRPVPVRQRRRAPHLRQAGRATCARSTACPAPASPSGRPTPSASAWWAISTTGTGAATRCARSARPGCGRSSFPAWAKARTTSTRSAIAHGNIVAEDRSVRLLLRDAAQERRHRLEQPQVRLDRRGLADAAAQRDPLRVAAEHLRGAPRLLAQEVRGRIAQLPRAGRAADRVRRSRWASPTWSSCRWPSTRFIRPGATR